MQLPAVAVAERAEPEHRAGQPERVADRDEVERGLASIERLADRRQGDVRDRQVEVRDGRDDDQRREDEARSLRSRARGLGAGLWLGRWQAALASVMTRPPRSRARRRRPGDRSSGPPRHSRWATRPVQPVWCDAPMPAPVSPWKYSWNSSRSRHSGSSRNFAIAPATGRWPVGVRQPDRDEPGREVRGHVAQPQPPPGAGRMLDGERHPRAPRPSAAATR